MKISPISTIPFLKQIKIYMKDKSISGGIGTPTPMDKIFEIADRAGSSVLVGKDVFISYYSEKKVEEELKKAGIEYEVIDESTDKN